MHSSSIEFTRHIYKVEEVQSSGTVYKMAETLELHRPKLPESIKRENDQGKHNGSGFNHWLRLKINGKWDDKKKTGLRPFDDIYYGDILSRDKRNLVVIHISEDQHLFVIDYFNGYYPFKRDEFLCNHPRFF